MENNNVSRGWRTTAIIFIVVSVIELLILIWAYSAGASMIEDENRCIINVCSIDEAVSYYYDDYTRLCECINTEGEVIKTEYITKR